jgi:cytochrome c-type biogenesis protein
VIPEFPLVAFAFSAGAGTFFAPCAYPLLPGYVSYYLGETAGEGRPDGGRVAGPGTGRVAGRVADALGAVMPSETAGRLVRAAVVGVVVSLGFFLVYGLLAGVTAAVGSRLLGSVSLLELVVGVVLLVVGTATALGYDLPTPTVRLPERRRSVGGFFAFGVLYAAAAAGCTAPVFVGVATVALGGSPAGAVLTFGAFAAGMSLLMLSVTLLAALGREAILQRLSASTGRLTRVAGVVLAIAGVVQLYYYLIVFDGAATLGL